MFAPLFQAPTTPPPLHLTRPPPLPQPPRYYNTAATTYYQAANRLEGALDSFMGQHLVYDDA